MVLSLRKVWKDSALPGTYSAQTRKLDEAADAVVDLEAVAARFRRQLQALRNDPARRAERISKACEYFLPLVEGLGLETILSVEVDNAEVRKRIKNTAGRYYDLDSELACTLKRIYSHVCHSPVVFERSPVKVKRYHPDVTHIFLLHRNVCIYCSTKGEGRYLSFFLHAVLIDGLR